MLPFPFTSMSRILLRLPLACKLAVTITSFFIGNDDKSTDGSCDRSKLFTLTRACQLSPLIWVFSKVTFPWAKLKSNLPPFKLILSISKPSLVPDTWNLPAKIDSWQPILSQSIVGKSANLKEDKLTSPCHVLALSDLLPITC